MKSEEIIKALMQQNQTLLDCIFGLVRNITTNEKQCKNHRESGGELIKALLNDEGVFDPFKGMDEETKKSFTNALKHTPDIISVLKKEQENEEERKREWKEKLGKR